MAMNRTTHPLAAVLFVVCLACCGCSSVALPAIDPTGERIFLPSPSYTTFASPYDSTPFFPCLPQPAFTEPSPIPPCETIPAGPTGMVGTGVGAPRPDRLILTPSKIVAPVNSEVVLLAGLCGREGYYVTKQPIEWMLSPDSVGNIISLAGTKHPHISHLVHHSPRKESNNLAITRTSTDAHVVSRGTPLQNDDIWVGKGQTWISVSSPTEGVSYVTALANSAENWDTRRQTATIYWVDMQWSFPAPTVVRAGEAAVLSTAVSKTSTGNPAANATVRYEVTGGTPASFFGNGRTSVEVPTDENGRANVQLVQDTPGPGATQVRIQIFSRNSQDSTARVPLGQGFTTVTWSAPGLMLGISGPPLVSRGGTATFRIEVSNPGDIPTRSAVVRIDLPPALKYLNSQPAGQAFGARVEWALGDIAPRQSQHLEVNCQAVNGGEFQVVARATSQDTQETTAAATTQVVESGLTVRFVDPPAAAITGGRVEFNFEVTNTGGLPLTNVMVRDTFDQGLQPAYAGVDPVRPLEQPVGNLAPGQTVRKGIAFMVRGSGQLCHTLEVTAEGGHTASTRACINVTQPVLKVDVRKVGPTQARVGDRVRFVITVTNSGDGVLTNLRINDIPDANLIPSQGTSGLQKVGNAIVWQAGSLGPGQQLTYEIECICQTATDVAQNQVEVAADGNVGQSAVAQLEILPAVAAPKPAQSTQPASPTPAAPATPPASPSGQATGQLHLQAASYGDPRVGDNATIVVVLRNQSEQPEQDVQLTVLIPPEFSSVRVEQQTNAPVTPVAGGISIGPIREVRGGESIDQLRINATASKPGRYTIRIRAESRRTRSVETEVDINVVPR